MTDPTPDRIRAARRTDTAAMIDIERAAGEMFRAKKTVERMTRVINALDVGRLGEKREF